LSIVRSRTVNGEVRLVWYWAMLLFLVIYVILSIALVLLAVWWTGDMRAGGPALGIGFATSLLVWWRTVLAILHHSRKA
jgi:hypothetical protein